MEPRLSRPQALLLRVWILQEQRRWELTIHIVDTPKQPLIPSPRPKSLKFNLENFEFTVTSYTKILIP